jgi:hypothetical protein
MAVQCKALRYVKNEALHRHLRTGAKVQRIHSFAPARSNPELVSKIDQPLGLCQ